MKMEYMGTEYVGQCPRRGYQSHMAADMVRTLGRRNGNDAFVVNQQRPNPGILKFQKRKAREKQREKKKISQGITGGLVPGSSRSWPTLHLSSRS